MKTKKRVDPYRILTERAYKAYTESDPVEIFGDGNGTYSINLFGAVTQGLTQEGLNEVLEDLASEVEMANMVDSAVDYLIDVCPRPNSNPDLCANDYVRYAFSDMDEETIRKVIRCAAEEYRTL